MRILTDADLDDDWDWEPEKIVCPKCLEFGYENRLGPKILMPGEIKSDDYHDWLECGTCGWLCPIYSVAKEANIKNAVETVESPTDDKLQLVSAHKKRKPIRKVSRHINKHIRKTKDADIAREIRQHGSDRVKVLVDTDP
jgi:hypothetical protein